MATARGTAGLLPGRRREEFIAAHPGSRIEPGGKGWLAEVPLAGGGTGYATRKHLPDLMDELEGDEITPRSEDSAPGELAGE